jgi:hypothetical protein
MKSNHQGGEQVRESGLERTDEGNRMRFPLIRAAPIL